MKTKIDLAPRRKYLMGWVSGTWNELQGEFLNERRGQPRRALTGGPAVSMPETIVYKTKEAAMKAAPRASTGAVSMVRAYVYSTPNPKNARGMTPMEDVAGPLRLALSPAGSWEPFNPYANP